MVVARTDMTIWRRWQDRAMAEFIESGNAFSRGPELESAVV
jgi:hypothetical protein